jgi:hypothetical protein
VTADPQRTTPVLHNMSSRPRTMVDVRVAPVDGRLVSFALDHMASQLNRFVGGRTRATVRSTLATYACSGDLAALAARLDHVWAARRLRGAVLFYEGPLPGPDLRPTPCLDPLVVLNVLARARGNLLLPDAPLVLQPRALDRSLVTDDPRLTSLLSSEVPGR